MCEKLQDIVTSTQMKKDVGMLSSDTQTSDLESFHSLLNQFAPKMIGFSYCGLRTRYFDKHSLYKNFESYNWCQRWENIVMSQYKIVELRFWCHWKERKKVFQKLSPLINPALKLYEASFTLKIEVKVFALYNEVFDYYTDLRCTGVGRHRQGGHSPWPRNSF